MAKKKKQGVAWSATVKEELGVAPTPPSKNEPTKRETRAAAERKANRRQKTRRWTAYSGEEALKQKIYARLERLECTNYDDPLDKSAADDGAADSESYSDQSDHESSSDDQSDDDESFGKKTPQKKRKVKKEKQEPKKRPRKSKRKTKPRIKARKVKSLAEMLLNDNAAKLKRCKTIEDLNAPDYFNATAKPSKYPKRNFCVITGNIGRYKDPESLLYYSSQKAYNELKEQPPSWLRSSGIAPYYEAMEAIKLERKAFAAKHSRS